jgi:hypothetical protein
MKLSASLVAALVLVVSAVALAAPATIDQIQRYMKGGAVVIGSLQVGSAATTATAANAVTKMLAGSSTIDFAAASVGVAESSGITVTGAVVGDTCEVGPPAAAGAMKAGFECYVSAADTVKVKFLPKDELAACAALTAGTLGVTVTASSIGTCSSTTANAVRCSVSSTTFTLTGTGTDTVCYSINQPVDPASGTYRVRVTSAQ